VVILNRKMTVITLLVLIILANNFSACTALNTSQPTDSGDQVIDSRILPAEQSESTQRMQSTQTELTPTKTNPWGIALDEARGFVWVAEPGCEMSPTCPNTVATYIGKYALSDGSAIANFPEPDQASGAKYSSPLFVAVNHSNGHVWFTEPDSNAIGELDPDTGAWYNYARGMTPGSAPYDLVFDKNGNIWFTEFNGNNIGFLNTKTHTIVETPMPTAGSNPYGITVDARGHIWLAENGQGASKIATFTPTTTGNISITEYLIDPVLITRPHLITVDPHGTVWFSDGFTGNISEFDPATQVVTHFKVATQCRRVNNCTHISGIMADGQGHIWFTDSLNATVGYFDPVNSIEKIQPIRDPNAHPHDGLVIQSNGTAWFTEQYGSQLRGDPVLGPVLVMWPKGVLK
jgi:virginiamycin B lyase